MTKTTWVSRNPELAKQLIVESKERLAILEAQEAEAKAKAGKGH